MEEEIVQIVITEPSQAGIKIPLTVSAPYTLNPDNNGYTIRANSVNAAKIIIPHSTTADIKVGSKFYIEQKNVGAPYITGAPGVTINTNAVRSVSRHSIMTIECMALNEYNVYGGLDLIKEIIDAYKIRVEADGGTVENELGLIDFLQNVV